MRQLTDEEAKEIFKKMHEHIGLEYKGINSLKGRWFMKHSWTEEQEEEFKKWLFTYLKPKLRVPTKMLKDSISFFMLQYGWKTKE